MTRGFFADKATTSPANYNYRDYLQGRRGGGKLGYYVVQRDWHDRFTIEEASVLGHLLNTGQLRADDDGWFLCNATFLAKAFGGAEDVEQVLHALIDLGVVQIQRRPSGRHVRVNVAKLPA